jgi:hypothetical protein
MKKAITLLIASLAALFFLGYYKETGEFKDYLHVFIKKTPTPQVKFENIFANLRDHRQLHELTPRERQRVIDYCKYRLGVETQLESQNELERCKEL